MSAQAATKVDIEDSNLGREPVASPTSRWVTLLFSVTLLVLAGLAIRELWIRTQNTTWEPIAPTFTNWVGTLSWQMWMLPVACVCVIVGIILLYISVRPRTKTHQRLNDNGVSLWMRPIDIARMTTSQARQIPGVDEARTEVKKGGQVHLLITGDSEDPTLADRVAHTIKPLVAHIAGSPKLAIEIRQKEEQR